MITPAILVGTGVGDALGLTFEKLDDKVDDRLATWNGNYLPCQRLKLPAGSVSDDTDMSECLATSLIKCKGFSGSDTAERYLAWSQATPHGMGGTTRAAMLKLAQGLPYTDSGIKFDNPNEVGSGPPMRAASIGAYYYAPSSIHDICHLDARITHSDREADAASYAVALMTRLMLNKMPIARAFDYLVEEVAHRDQHPASIVKQPTTLVCQDLQFALTKFKAGATLDEVVPKSFSRRGNARSITVTAIYCAVIHDNFRDGVMAAIKLGGDTDTRGAIAGAILGARFGLEGISDEHKSGLLKFEQLKQLDQQLCAAHL